MSTENGPNEYLRGFYENEKGRGDRKELPLGYSANNARSKIAGLGMDGVLDKNGL